jgi:hypothetical protein
MKEVFSAIFHRLHIYIPELSKFCESTRISVYHGVTFQKLSCIPAGIFTQSEISNMSQFSLCSLVFGTSARSSNVLLYIRAIHLETFTVSLLISVAA